VDRFDGATLFGGIISATRAARLCFRGRPRAGERFNTTSMPNGWPMHPLDGGAGREARPTRGALIKLRGCQQICFEWLRHPENVCAATFDRRYRATRRRRSESFTTRPAGCLIDPNERPRKGPHIECDHTLFRSAPPNLAIAPVNAMFQRIFSRPGPSADLP
jgi:hypothetical protein